MATHLAVADTADWISAIADSVSALATSAAFLAAAWAVRVAIRTNDYQARQLEQLEGFERERRDEQRRLQAEQVAVWLDGGPVQTAYQAAAIYAQNLSNSPVYSGAVFVQLFNKCMHSPFRTSRPERERLLKRASDELHQWAKELTQTDPRFARSLRERGHLSDDESILWSTLWTTQYFRVAMSFRDSSGRYWLRGFDGELHAVDSEDGVAELIDRAVRRVDEP